MSAYAPIAVFAHRRLEPLQALLASLAANPEAAASPLYLFCDAARRDSERTAVAAVCAYAEQVAGFATVTVIKRPDNLGLARSIISGVSQVLAAHERVIVLEDDLRVSQYFLAYMNAALARYATDTRVASVHGYVYTVAAALPETFFLRGADCWGWGTWQRAWQGFDCDGSRLLAQLKANRQTHLFDLDGAYPFTRMLRDQISGRNDSWAIRWHAAMFLRGMLTLYPGRSLVLNTGLDGSGTHCNEDSEMRGILATGPVEVRDIPVVEDAAARRAIIRFFRRWWWRKLAYLCRHPRQAWTTLFGALKKLV